MVELKISRRHQMIGIPCIRALIADWEWQSSPEAASVLALVEYFEAFTTGVSLGAPACRLIGRAYDVFGLNVVAKAIVRACGKHLQFTTNGHCVGASSDTALDTLLAECREVADAEK